MRLAQWASIMRKRSESGKSIRVWCQENEINEKTYHYWQKKLRNVACEQLEKLKAPQQMNLVHGFTEVKLPEPIASSMLMSETHSNQLIINIGELQITADSKYPPKNLAELLRELIPLQYNVQHA